MGWFRTDLKENIEGIIAQIKQKTLQFDPIHNWRQAEVRKLETLDVELLSELIELHKQGRDLPEIGLAIINEVRSLKKHIDQLIDNPQTAVAEKEIMKDLIIEIEKLFKQEQDYLRHSEENGLHTRRGNSFPAKIIEYFTQQSIKAEKNGVPLKTFLSLVGIDTDGLYRYLVGAYGDVKVSGDILSRVRLELSKIPKLKTSASGFKNSNGWYFFTLNRGQTKQIKAYIAVEPASFTAEAFVLVIDYLMNIKYDGEIKIHDSATSFCRRNDQIVLFGDSQSQVIRGAQLVKKILKDRGCHIVQSPSISKDIILPPIDGFTDKEESFSYTEAVSLIACYYMREALKSRGHRIKDYPYFREGLSRLYGQSGPFRDYMNLLNKRIIKCDVI